ncbi:hypothetical protein MNBD_GAMMA16-890 [hydrothermal vent metagenome]|uniref:Glycosyltransferase family 1 protein n=1 Tax=hydrothermal vent metagenome TaxID=652676 RepID=A0A3B0ZIQ3_9ZZZZ
MPKNFSVLVLELHPYHTHNFSIYSNLLPSLVCRNTVNIEYYVNPEVVDGLIYPEKQHLHRLLPSVFWDRMLSKFRLRTAYIILLVKLLCILKRIDCVVLNTLESTTDKRVFRSINTKLKIAVVHNPKVIDVKREKNALYFCMNEYVFQGMNNSAPLDGYFLSYFKPMEFKKTVMSETLTIGVPGGVSFDRRDYHFLIQVCLKLAECEKPEREIIFNLIGDIGMKDGPEFRRLTEKNGINKYFRFHEELDDSQFNREIYECELLMPLIGDANTRYRSIKNTATLSHSARYHKPLLLQLEDAKCWGIPQHSCFIYSGLNDLTELLSQSKVVDREIKDTYQAHIEKKIEKNKNLLSRLGERFFTPGKF